MIIFISSALGAGKTTTAKELAKRIPSAVLVDPDVFAEMCEYSMSFEEYSPVREELTESTVRYFNTKGSIVIVPGSITESYLETLKNRYNDIWSDVRIVCLNPDKSTVLAGRGDRTLSDWEKERVEYHYENKATSLPDAECIIDTSSISPEETAEEIVRMLEFAKQ